MLQEVLPGRLADQRDDLLDVWMHHLLHEVLQGKLWQRSGPAPFQVSDGGADSRSDPGFRDAESDTGKKKMVSWRKIVMLFYESVLDYYTVPSK